MKFRRWVAIGGIVAGAAILLFAPIVRMEFTVEFPSGGGLPTFSNMQTSTTPLVFPRVDREAEFQVTITKPGYRTWTGGVSHQTAGGGAAGMAGNVILGGVIGLAIDANSGATQELVPNPLHVVLEPEGAEAPAAAPAAAEPAAEPAPAPPAQ